MYTELPLKERFEAAATEALGAVELFSHYVLPKAEMAVMLMANGLALVPINAPPGGDDAASIAAWQVWDGCVLRVCRRAFAPPDRIRLIESAGS